MLHTAAARVGGLDLGFVPGAGRARRGAQWRKPARSMCSSFSAPTRSTIAAGRFRHLSGLAWRSRRRDAPTSSCRARPIPKNPALYVNTEGRVQLADRANFPPGDAREDWAILRALSDVLGQNCRSIRCEPCARRLYAAHPHFAEIDAIAAAAAFRYREHSPRQGTAVCAARPLFRAVADFYLTNPIARASAVMAECSALAKARARRRRSKADDIWFAATWPLLLTLVKSVVLLVAAFDLHRLYPLRGSQDLGGGAVAARSQCGRSLGALAKLRRHAEVRRSRSRSSRTARTRAFFCWRPSSWGMLALAAWAVIPVERRLGDRQYQCRHSLYLRDLVAQRLWHHHGRLGVELEISVSVGAALGGANDVL